MAAPVVGNHSEALVEEEQQLRIPIIGRQRPAVAKHYGLTFAPVFIVNLRAVFGRNRAHSLENGNAKLTLFKPVFVDLQGSNFRFQPRGRNADTRHRHA
jgi:hypothetical protein